MKLKAFVIYDSKVESYQQPHFMKTEGQMRRAVYQAFKDQNTDLAKYPEDFIMYYIGEFDDQTAVIEQQPPVTVGSVLHIALTEMKAEKKAQRLIEQMNGEEDEISNDA